MNNIEDKVKDFAKSLGIEIVGVAGPDQLDGPTSTDAGYVLSGSRFQMLTTFVSKVWPEELFTKDKLGKEMEDYPEVNTCGNCAQVCAGADITESAKRLKILRQSGMVVKRGDGSHVVVKTFVEAQEIRKKDPHVIGIRQKIKEQLLSAKYALVSMFGFEPKGLIQNFFYQKRLKKAITEKQPEDRMATLAEDRSAAGTKLLEELNLIQEN